MELEPISDISQRSGVFTPVRGDDGPREIGIIPRFHLTSTDIE